MLITSKGKAKNTQELISASVQILIEALESGHSEVLEQYLKAMARFHHYSFGNIMLIAAQKRDASHVAGMYAWNQLGRRVKRGEKGIMILAPMLGKKRNNNTDAHSENAPSEGRESGKRDWSLIGFRPVYVWDVSQTEGKALPELEEVPGVINDFSYPKRSLLKWYASRQISVVNVPLHRRPPFPSSCKLRKEIWSSF